LQQWKLHQQQKHLSARLHRRSSEHKSFHGIWYGRHSWLHLLSNTLLRPEKWSWECIKDEESEVNTMNDVRDPWQSCGVLFNESYFVSCRDDIFKLVAYHVKNHSKMIFLSWVVLKLWFRCKNNLKNNLHVQLDWKTKKEN